MNQQFVEGMSVFDANDDKVGSVHDYDPRGGYLVVQKGWLFPKDLYIPLGAVERNDADGVYLNLHKDDLGQHAYDEPPAGYVSSRGNMAETDAVAARAEAPSRAATAETTVVEDVTDLRVPVLEEELLVGKRAEEMGRVHIHKDVVTERQTVGAPLTHEEVYVERMPVQGQYSGIPSDAFTEKDIDITVMGETLVVGKRTLAAEEVRVHKDTILEERQVVDTLRKERVVVDGVDETQTPERENYRQS